VKISSAVVGEGALANMTLIAFMIFVPSFENGSTIGNIDKLVVLPNESLQQT
jgi:hypothetical protein